MATPVAASAAAATQLAVTAVLLANSVDDTLVDALHALAASARPAERLLLLDATGAGELAQTLDHATALRAELPPTTVLRAAGADIPAALRQARAEDPDADAYWLLTGATVPEPGALGQLAGLLAGSRTAGLAAPKLLDRGRPGRLARFGIQVSRSGRLQPNPRPGTPDQQQFDDRTDALAAPAEGLLIRRTAYDDLGGQQAWLGRLGTDLDLGWRAQLAGHRVVLAPRARVELAGGSPHPPTGAQRRDSRRVALARRPWYLMPLLWLWILVSVLGLALGLLLLKRPRAAGRQLAELGALVDPWRPLAARWRSRGRRRVPARALRGLFVAPGQTRAHAADRLHDVLVPRRAGRATGATPITLHTASGAGLWSSPLIWGPLLLLAGTIAAFRLLPGGAPAAARDGLMGGQLRYVRADAASLWRTWWESWSGPGLGSADAGSPGAAVLALLTWVYQALPGDAGPSPVARVVGILVLLTPAFAFVAAYLAARVLTPARLPRALAAGAWALCPPALDAVREGRLGALALLVGLPLLGAGFVALTRRETRPGMAALTALLTAALATVVPGVLILGLGVALGLLLFGSAYARRRATGYLPLTALAAAPVLLMLAERPAALLGGWGLLAAPVAQVTQVPVWQSALGFPDGTLLGDGVPGLNELGVRPVVVRLVLVVPIVAAGLLGLARPRRGTLPVSLAVLGLAGLAWTLGAGRVELASAGGVNPWRGTGALVMILALLAAALLAAGRQSGIAWRAAVSTLVAISAVAGVVVLAVAGIGTDLRPGADPRPAVAIDQATGPLATRTLLITADEPPWADPAGGTAYSYDLIGREPDLPARDLGPARSRELDTTIAGLLDAADPGAAGGAGLARWAVGFLVVDPSAGDALPRRLDATAGLTRIGDHAGRAVWRVTTADDRLARVLVTGTGTATTPLAVSGDHAETRLLAPGAGASELTVAQSAGWATQARVRADGQPLTPVTTQDGQLRYHLPSGTDKVRIAVPTRHGTWGWLYLAALALLAYIALPIGAAPNRRREADV